MKLVPASCEDYRTLAEKRLPRFLFDYVDGGAYQEQTLRSNVDDFQSLPIRQSVMRDVSHIDLSAKLLGQSCEMPLALAPVGMAGMLARRGEVQAKRAADAGGVPFCLSTVSICPLEEVAAVSAIPFWFQLYMLRDRGIIQELLERAWGVGVRTLVFTVDLAVVGERYRDTRNGIAGGASAWGRLRSGPLSYLSHPRWLMDVGLKGKPHTFANLASYVASATNPAEYRSWMVSQLDASVTWKDIEWLRSIWKGKLLIKGVMTAEDALAAVDAGADAVSVSNHGGRQLDGVRSAISAVPAVAEALAGRAEVIMDGGVRSGLDVFRARAMGADGVMIGRAWAYALAARGEAGLSAVLASLKGEMRTGMGLTGVIGTDDIGPHLLDR